ncbi:MAG: hypothetical protein KKH54_07060 [Alphaproteobacteria bacterium]|jgi:hypothetical protein|nr:hypothetical protein [Alphaproteobacteria bacterium]
MSRRLTWSKPKGQFWADELKAGDAEALRTQAATQGQLELFEVAFAVHSQDPAPAFLHSVLCSMSLPTKRPQGDKEFQPIIRQDGSYSLAVTPKPRLIRNSEGQSELVNLGVPFGAYPRIILISILSQAVMKTSRDVFLGGSFRDMMRRFGYEGASRGRRGQTDKLVEQLDRLLACEWMINWEASDPGKAESAFKVDEVKLSHNYSGLNNPDGTFNRELRISETFFEHLREHAVRLDMNAIHAVRTKPTAIDLYTYLAFRLPRIPEGKVVELNYEQLAVHMGNSMESPAQVRWKLKNTLDLVAGLYPEARIEIGDRSIKMRNSPRPVADRVSKVPVKALPKAKRDATKATKASDDRATHQPTLGLIEQSEIEFPTGSLRYASDGEVFVEIAREHGNGYDIDMIADNYRAFMKSKGEMPTGKRLIASWTGFCEKFKPYMGNQ